MCGTVDDLRLLRMMDPELEQWENEGGHAPAIADNRFPRMGGKPNKGTKKDKRLKENRKGGRK